MVAERLVVELGMTGWSEFRFWFQDSAYAEVLKQRGMKHALIGTAKLDHYESKTLHGQENKYPQGCFRPLVKSISEAIVHFNVTHLDSSCSSIRLHAIS